MKVELLFAVILGFTVLFTYYGTEEQMMAPLLNTPFGLVACETSSLWFGIPWNSIH